MTGHDPEVLAIVDLVMGKINATVKAVGGGMPSLAQALDMLRTATDGYVAIAILIDPELAKKAREILDPTSNN